MKKILLSLFVVTICTNLMAQKPDEVAKFNQETIELGKIKNLVPVTATFIVKNTGKTPLIIERADASCGCTIGEYTKAPIAPGKEGWIKAIYDAKSLGSFTKNLTVKFAGMNDTKSIAIKGEVLSVADYAKLKTNGNKTKSVIKTDAQKTKSKVKTKQTKNAVAVTNPTM